MHNLDLILTLAGGFTAALILGYLTQRAGLSPIAVRRVAIPGAIATVRGVRDKGIDAVYGDATKQVTLEAAGVAHAETVILATAGMGDAAEVIRMARERLRAHRELFDKQTARSHSQV